MRSLRAGAIHDLNSSKMRSISSAAYNRGIHSNSRQTDQMRSEIGGRASAQDSASTYMRSMLMELKKPQPSDIIPVFRLTKARKKSSAEVTSQQASNGSSPKMHKVQLINEKPKQQHVSQEMTSNHLKINMERIEEAKIASPESSQLPSSRVQPASRSSLIKIVDYH